MDPNPHMEASAVQGGACDVLLEQLEGSEDENSPSTDSARKWFNISKGSFEIKE